MVKSGRNICTTIGLGQHDRMGASGKHFDVARHMRRVHLLQPSTCANGQKRQKSEHARAHQRRGERSPARWVDRHQWGGQPHALCPSSPFLPRRGRPHQVELLRAAEPLPMSRMRATLARAGSPQRRCRWPAQHLLVVLDDRWPAGRRRRCCRAPAAGRGSGSFSC